MRAIVTSHPLGGRFSQPVELLSHVYLGSQLHAESLKILRRHGITHVLNCAGYLGPREKPEKSPYEGLGIDYLEFKASDADDYDMTQHFSQAIRYLDKVQQLGGRALVHCAMGINRSVAVAIAYIMWHKKNWPLLKTVQYVKDRRNLCLSNEGFCVQLVQYARAKGYLDELPPRRSRRYEDDDAKARSREVSRSLPRDPVISKVFAKDHFKQSDSLIDTGLMFRVERFLNREKV